ncbi:hypothetical protein BU23DRAFT_644403 [Bimuria novae-zelandiae CBS 107.79]|uniref:Heterokaryon incompatibility domain-containing protein n=1 Tax=Bimuria novae-zelandiae CBS 107.79 TaxID=1447943 RepID=A0A6A5V6B9_9PLEO|nr:hypothetical protein BU23DRAFT_644403 [Bimuria novae-zelandiae CBS 107.79]
MACVDNIVTNFTQRRRKSIETGVEPVRLLHDLLAFTLPNDPAASYVTARPIHTDIRVDTVQDKLQSWLESCSSHDCCRQTTDVRLPTHVIELHPSGDLEHVRLLESNGHRGQYATLSYCWGAPSDSILTSATRHQYLSQIPWSNIPQTIKDAIVVARAARMQDVWVDAFYILQDS